MRTRCRRSRRIAGPTTSAACARRWNARCCSAMARLTRSATCCVHPAPPSRYRSPPDLSLARNEETLITAALERHAFNVSRAAAQLGLTRAALYRRMARYGL
ncbi:helix-turn-helix domain-containing protein [Sphingomonas sp. H160509]